MATLTVYDNFTKRKNSTKRPSGGTSVNVKLKENTSMENPVFIVKGLLNANYCEYLGNYYFVNDVVFVTNEIVELHCSMDALATNKNNIIGSPQYVSYYTHVNNDIVDTRLSTKTVPTTQVSTGSFSKLGNGSSYLVGVTGVDGVTIYACDRSTVDDLLPSDKLDAVMDNWHDNLQNIRDIDIDISNIISVVKSGVLAFVTVAVNLVEMLFEVDHSLNTFDSSQGSVRNCFILPLAVSELGGTSSDIMLGRLNTGKSGNKGLTRVIHDSAVVSIPWQATDWRRNTPYHNIYLYIPYIGLVTLPTSELIGANTITINVSIDTYSGNAIFQAVASNNQIVGHWTTNLASSYAIGTSNIDMSGMAQNVVNAGVGVASGIVSENYVGAVGSVLGLQNGISMYNTTIGCNSGMAGQGLGNNCRCISVFHDTTVEPSSVSAIKGTPYNGVIHIPSSGYVQCVNADVETTAYGNEKNEINNALNSGVYIE